jgi:hypothetical protein
MVFVLRNLVRNASALRRYRFYKESLSIISVRHHSYDPDGKTTVELLNKNLEVLMIDSYSQIQPEADTTADSHTEPLRQQHTEE